MSDRTARLGALVSAPTTAPKPPRRRPDPQAARRAIRRTRWAAWRVVRTAPWAAWRVVRSRRRAASLMRRLGAWCAWALLAAAPAGVALWLLMSEISFAGYKAGRGLILMLFGLSALAVARRRDLVNDIEDTLERR